MKKRTIIFDIDGTIVDTEKSYSEAIKQTVLTYLAFLGLKKCFLKNKDIQTLKNIGGFNNDWDTVSAFLSYFLSFVNLTNSKLLKIDLTMPQKINYHYQFKTKPNSLETFFKTIKQYGLNNSVKIKQYYKVEDLLFDYGSLLKTNLVQRIFQEIYLGKKLFIDFYQATPFFYKKNKGLYIKEKLLLNKKLLCKLAKNNKLAIATGRVYKEAVLVLERFKIKQFFDLIISDDDVLAQERKPKPCILYLVAKKLKTDSYLYIGDLLDDVIAANSAKEKIAIKSVNISKIKNTKADFTFADINDCLKAII